MKINFSISEFVIAESEIKPVSLEIADKILKYHIAPMQTLRNALKAQIWASKKSGYRSVNWEIAHERSGCSEHCFKGKGAVDWTTKKKKIFNLGLLLADSGVYNRICYYPNKNFFHCDYKQLIGKARHRFFIDYLGEWKELSITGFRSTIALHCG